MELSTALAIFKQLETARDTEIEGDPSTYNVRLDAKTDEVGQRYFAVRITIGRGLGGVFTADDMRYVLDVALEHDREDVTVENSAIVIA